MLLIKNRKSIIVGLLVGVMLPLSVQAELHGSTGNTSVAGGTGGSKTQGTCPIETRVSGVRIKHGDVIDRIAYRCTPISPTGRWAGSSYWKGYSNSSAPIPATQTKTAVCPSDKFVGSVKGWTKNKVLNRLQFKCYRSDSDGKRISAGNNVISLQASTGGSDSNWNYCPGNGIAAAVMSYTGWHVDGVALNCWKGTLLSLPKPNLASPANNATVSTNATVRLSWSNVTGANYYQLYMKDQANNVGIDPRTGANVPVSNVTRVESSSYTVPLTALRVMSNNGNGRNILWWVSACPNQDNSNDCKAASPRVFKISADNKPSQVGIPILRSPGDGQFAYNNSPLTLKWDFVNGAKSYLITMRSRTTGAYIDPNTGNEKPSATTIRRTGNQLVLSKTILSKLVTLGHIEWKVKACPNTNNSVSCGQYTAARAFNVRARR